MPKYRPYAGARMSGEGHEERFRPTRLSGCCGFRKGTIAGMRRNGEMRRNQPFACHGWNEWNRPRADVRRQRARFEMRTTNVNCDSLLNVQA